MTNEEFEKRIESGIQQAERAVTRLAEQISEDSKKLNAKLDILRSLQDRYFREGNGQTGP